MSEALERVLQLAHAARAAHDSSLWKTDIDTAIEVHGEACDALWAELYGLLDQRVAAGDPVLKARMLPDPRKELKKAIIARVREELPSMVASIIDEF